MTDHDMNIDTYHKLKPADFGFLECLELRQSVNPETWHGFTLSIVLCSAAGRAAKRLKLVFSGVQNLRIGRLQGLLRYVVDIRPIREEHMEALNYSVSECEYSAFSFLCDSFTASIDDNQAGRGGDA